MAWWLLGGMGTQRSSQISTARVNPGSPVYGKEQVGAEGRLLPGKADVAAEGLAGRREPPLLVVFLVSGKVALRHHAEQAPRLDHGGRVEELAVHGHRQTQDDHGRVVGRLPQETAQGAFRAAHQGREAEEEVARRVPGEGQLGEHEGLDALAPGFSRQTQDLGDVVIGVGHAQARTRGADAHESEWGHGHVHSITPPEARPNGRG